MPGWVWFPIVFSAIALFGMAAGWGEALAKRRRELDVAYAARVRELEEQHAVRLGALDEREAGLDRRHASQEARDAAFLKSFSEGRAWFSRLFADAEAAVDDARERALLVKRQPARVAADVVREIKAEKRTMRERLKLLEYQLASYEEYFPILADYREVILDERIPLGAGRNNLAALEDADPVMKFVSGDEYERLSDTEKNQLALDRYLARDLADWEIGRLYERFLGWRYEREGWSVAYQGAIKGFEDMGRDLVCTKGPEVHIVQAKCWSRRKELHEKHVFQLYGSTVQYQMDHQGQRVVPVLAATTGLSPLATRIAEDLGVTVRGIALDKTYPMIKCNVALRTGEGIYHLPFDQQYDRVVIGNREGECYVRTVKEAERRGFRRAWRFRGGDEG